MSRQDSLPKGFTFWKLNFNDKTAAKGFTFWKLNFNDKTAAKGFTFWKQNFNDKTAGKLNFTNERLKETDLP